EPDRYSRPVCTMRPSAPGMPPRSRKLTTVEKVAVRTSTRRQYRSDRRNGIGRIDGSSSLLLPSIECPTLPREVAFLFGAAALGVRPQRRSGGRRDHPARGGWYGGRRRGLPHRVRVAVVAADLLAVRLAADGVRVEL